MMVVGYSNSYPTYKAWGGGKGHTEEKNQTSSFFLLNNE